LAEIWPQRRGATARRSADRNAVWSILAAGPHRDLVSLLSVSTISALPGCSRRPVDEPTADEDAATNVRQRGDRGGLPSRRAHDFAVIASSTSASCSAQCRPDCTTNVHDADCALSTGFQKPLTPGYAA
jgi:hypothetical protein